MTFSDQLSITFLVGLALSALTFVAAPLLPGLLTALGGNMIVSASIVAALMAVACMLAALLTALR